MCQEPHSRVRASLRCCREPLEAFGPFFLGHSAQGRVRNLLQHSGLKAYGLSLTGWCARYVAMARDPRPDGGVGVSPPGCSPLRGPGPSVVRSPSAFCRGNDGRDNFFIPAIVFSSCPFGWGAPFRGRGIAGHTIFGAMCSAGGGPPGRLSSTTHLGSSVAH